jgi:glycosyltransferase involved in cell wall biosynthesis
MKKLRIVNLLDDFALGGVTNGLRIFESPELRDLGNFQTIAFDGDAWIAPRLDADIIITHSPPNWRRIIWFHSLRLRNPKAMLIHVEHSYSKDWAEQHVSHFVQFRFMMELALKPMDEVVVVSKALEVWMREERMVKPDRLHVIYPYSNVPGLNDVPDIDISPDKPIIVGAYGRFCDAKGFDRLIDAFKDTNKSDNLRLLLGGFGPIDAMLRKKAADCDRISFAGKVTNIAGFLRKCDVIAVPSRFEAYGQVANEAREAGRPILVSNAGGLPEQARSGGMIIDCDDPDALRNALQSLRSMPLQSMGKNARISTAGCRSERIEKWRRLLSPRQAFTAHTAT